jgi:hypothetical protein
MFLDVTSQNSNKLGAEPTGIVIEKVTKPPVKVTVQLLDIDAIDNRTTFALRVNDVEFVGFFDEGSPQNLMSKSAHERLSLTTVLSPSALSYTSSVGNGEAKVHGELDCVVAFDKMAFNARVCVIDEKWPQNFILLGSAFKKHLSDSGILVTSDLTLRDVHSNKRGLIKNGYRVKDKNLKRLGNAVDKKKTPKKPLELKLAYKGQEK